MSAPMCGDVRELAPELALGIVGGPERADALQHASECGPCRALIGELAEAADALTLLAPESEPPPGFEERVLAALKAPRRVCMWSAIAMTEAALQPGGRKANRVARPYRKGGRVASATRCPRHADPFAIRRPATKSAHTKQFKNGRNTNRR